jgi:hypothetical protein
MNIKDLGSLPTLEAPPNGLKDDTRSIGPNTVMQHLDRIWMLTCFDNLCVFWRAFDVRPLGLASLSNQLSNHMWIIQNGARTRPGWLVQGRLVLETEADLNSCWAKPPTSIGRPGWSSSPPPLPLSSSWPSPIFLINITSLGSNLFSKV